MCIHESSVTSLVIALKYIIFVDAGANGDTL